MKYHIISVRRMELADRMCRAMAGLLGRVFVRIPEHGKLHSIYVKGETSAAELRCYRRIAQALRKLASVHKTASKQLLTTANKG